MGPSSTRQNVRLFLLQVFTIGTVPLWRMDSAVFFAFFSTPKIPICINGFSKLKRTSLAGGVVDADSVEVGVDDETLVSPEAKPVVLPLWSGMFPVIERFRNATTIRFAGSPADIPNASVPSEDNMSLGPGLALS